MAQGLQDLLGSERGVYVIFLTFAITVLLFLGRITAADWISYTQWLAGGLLVSKTVSHAVEHFAVVASDRLDKIPSATIVGGDTGADKP